jgi:hypothetical protein
VRVVLSGHDLPQVLIGDALLRLRGLRDDRERFLAVRQYRPLRTLLANRLWGEEIASQISKLKTTVDPSNTSSSSSAAMPGSKGVPKGELEDLACWSPTDHRLCRGNHCQQVILKFKHTCCITWKCYLCKTITAQQWLPRSDKYVDDEVAKYAHNVIRMAAEATQELTENQLRYEASGMAPNYVKSAGMEIKRGCVPSPFTYDDKKRCFETRKWG